MDLPKILIIPDVPNWIWHNKAKALQKHLSDVFNIDIVFYPQYKEEMSKGYNATLAMPWYGSYKAPRNLHTAICSYGFDRIANSEKRLREFKKITCVSRKIYEIFLEKGFENLTLCMNGVEEGLFKPAPIPHKGFKVLMVGKKGGHNDSASFEFIRRALVEQMVSIEWIQNDYRNAIPLSDMPSVYNNADLYVHISKPEGTPNPLFEAAACGLPCISNNIGCAPELLQPEYLIDTREKFIEKILEMRANPSKCKETGARNREEIVTNWTWKKRAKDYIDFFKGN
jgi:glycosyltransferase involved in cell wall biosynthesis